MIPCCYNNFFSSLPTWVGPCVCFFFLEWAIFFFLLCDLELTERIGNGPAEIVEMMRHIPRTKHPLESASDQHKFVVDSWQMPGLVNEATSPAGAVIYLSIHGEFQEFPSLTVRSFDRSFLLGAAGPASASVTPSPISKNNTSSLSPADPVFVDLFLEPP
jgi:hypothetical protein